MVKIFRLHLFLLFLGLSFQSFAQQSILTGVVKDSLTGRAITEAVIRTDAGKTVGKTNEKGEFSIVISQDIKSIRISSIGYNQKIIKISGAEDYLNVFLQESFVELAEVKIKKKRYRNKDNPAVELIRKVIENKSSNRNSGYEYLNYKEHEKVRIGFANTKERLLKSPVLKIFPALKNYFDSTRLEGRVFLPLWVQEHLNEYFQTPGDLVKNVLEEKTVKLDDNIFDNEGLKMMIAHAYQPFDIYENNMMFITNQFISPISDLAPSFYMFDLLDTVEVNGEKYAKLLFTPRNSTDLLFWGDMKIALSSYGVSEINLRTAKGINLNWVRNLEITQRFQKNTEGRFNLVISNVAMEFSITPKMHESFLTERIVSYLDYKINEPFNMKGSKSLEKPISKTIEENIGVDSSDYDDKIYTMLDSLKETKRFKTITNLVGLAAYGYFNAGKYLEIGTVYTFLGKNQLEGFRPRFGLRTMPSFSNKVFLEGFGAYGLKDEKWKYMGSVTYSFSGKNKYVFPMKNITATYRSDVEVPGNNLRYVEDHSFLLNIGRGEINKWLYYKRFTLRYVQEFENRLSYKIGLDHKIQNPGGGLAFVNENTGAIVSDLTTAEIKGEFRYAPHERFYQGKTSRSSVTTRYPIFTIRGSVGLKGFLGGQYNFQKLSLNVDKRFFLSPVGFTDATFETAGTFGKKLPFPLLDIMLANQSYTFQEHSFNMMNFMEFVADRFVAVKLEHNFNGSILNKVPLLSKLKFREFATFKVLYGGLSTQNKPGNGNNLFEFPTDSDGNVSTFNFHKAPYMEGSVGVGNIFKFFRVDVVKRFTYLNHPNVPSVGIRVRADFDF